MRKKNSSISRVVSMIKIDISGDLKYTVNESNNVYLFHLIHSWHLPFTNVICNIVVAVRFHTFELVIVFVMVSNDVSIM